MRYQQILEEVAEWEFLLSLCDEDGDAQGVMQATEEIGKLWDQLTIEPIPYNDGEDFDVDPAYLSHRDSSYGKLHRRQNHKSHRDERREVRRAVVRNESSF